MKLLLYIGILTGVLLLPIRGADVGKLIPVEVIAVSRTGPWITVETDTGNAGTGYTLDEAFVNLKDTAPGIIYMDTAEYVLLEEGVDPVSLRTHLKDNVKVYRAESGMELDQITDFLSAHGPGVQLKRVEKAGLLPTIIEENGRYLLIQK